MSALDLVFEAVFGAESEPQTASCTLDTPDRLDRLNTLDTLDTVSSLQSGPHWTLPSAQAASGLNGGVAIGPLCVGPSGARVLRLAAACVHRSIMLMNGARAAALAQVAGEHELSSRGATRKRRDNGAWWPAS